MNKRFLAGIVIASLMVSGCARENYLSEKEFYKAVKVLQSVKKEDIEKNGAEAFEKPLEAFRRVAEKYPSSYKAAESLFMISSLQIQQKKFKESRGTLEKVIQNFSGTGSWAESARLRIAKIYELEQRWTEAEKIYWEIAEYHPLQPNGLYAPILVYRHYAELNDATGKQESYEKGTDYYEKLIEQMGPIQATAGVRYHLGLLQYFGGKQDDAGKTWQALIKDFPESYYTPTALLSLGDLHETYLKQPDEALRIFKQFLDKYPSHPVAPKTATHVGILYSQKKNYERAREWYENVLKRYFKKDQRAQADVKLLIGKSYQDEGKWDDAEKIYNELERDYALMPSALQVPFMRYQYFEAKGESEKAKKILDEAIAHFQSLEKDYPDTDVTAYARHFMKSAYGAKGEWGNVAEAVDEDMQKETVGFRKGSWLLLKGLITEKRIQDKEKAKAIFRDFLDEYPDHPMAPVAKTHLETLSKA